MIDSKVTITSETKREEIYVYWAKQKLPMHPILEITMS
jgi:hypothetical protein